MLAVEAEEVMAPQRLEPEAKVAEVQVEMEHREPMELTTLAEVGEVLVAELIMVVMVEMEL